MTENNERPTSLCQTIITKQKKKSVQNQSMLFFFISVPTIKSGSLSNQRLECILLCLLVILCTLPEYSYAYPSSSLSSLSPSMEQMSNIHDRHQRWIVSNKYMLNPKIDNDSYLRRHSRATGFYIIRQGEYYVLVPDPNHHFTKNQRPYIGRRR